MRIVVNNKFRITCPECYSMVVTENPKVLIWELCPSCRHHVWDLEDILMADIYVPEKKDGTIALERNA